MTSYFELTSSSSSTPAGCRYGLELTQAVSRYDVPGRAQAWRMRVWVSDWYNISPNIFMMRRGVPDPVTGDISDNFMCMCSPVDLEEYPEGEPAVGQEPPFYRLAEVDLISRNREQLDEVWELLKADRDELIRTMVGICDMTVNEVSRGDESYFPAEEPTPTPTPPSPLGSSSSQGCPADAVTQLIVVTSNDADFPVGTTLNESGSSGGAPSCFRQWTMTGVVSGKDMVITTSMPLHTFTADYDGTEVATGGLATEYKALFTYTRGFDVDYELEIAAV